MKYDYSISELERMAASPWLTDRQRQVFDLKYRRGWAIDDIAAELYVGRRTVIRELAQIRRTIE